MPIYKIFTYLLEIIYTQNQIYFMWTHCDVETLKFKCLPEHIMVQFLIIKGDFIRSILNGT